MGKKIIIVVMGDPLLSCIPALICMGIAPHGIAIVSEDDLEARAHKLFPGMSVLDHSLDITDESMDTLAAEDLQLTNVLLLATIPGTASTEALEVVLGSFSRTQERLCLWSDRRGVEFRWLLHCDGACALARRLEMSAHLQAEPLLVDRGDFGHVVGAQF